MEMAQVDRFFNLFFSPLEGCGEGTGCGEPTWCRRAGGVYSRTTWLRPRPWRLCSWRPGAGIAGAWPAPLPPSSGSPSTSPGSRQPGQPPGKSLPQYSLSGLSFSYLLSKGQSREKFRLFSNERIDPGLSKNRGRWLQLPIHWSSSVILKGSRGS